MSFELMVALSAVEYPVTVDGGIVLVGYHTILVPTKVEADYAQFHLEVDYERQINPFILEFDDRALLTDYASLKSKRCFLGWCESAHVKLGTQDLPSTVRYSSAKEKEKTLHCSGLATGFQLTSAAPIQAGINGQTTFSFRSHRLYFTPPTIYSKMLLDAAKQTVLIYDTEARRSWLVSKLSLLVHMAHVWYISFEVSLDGVNRNDPIPFAQPHNGGMDLARQFEGHGDIVLSGNGNDVFRLRNLLLGFNINLLESKRLNKESTSQSLYGFEFMDITLEPGKGTVMKCAKIKKSRNWLALANLVDAVILCADLGDAMAPANCSSRKNSSCNSLPCGNDYLAAHVSCLAVLVSRCGQELTAQPSPPQVRLSEKNLWIVLGDPFEACQHDNGSSKSCWDRANLLQKICEKNRLSSWNNGIKSKARNSSSRLSLKGAVVFGETSDS